MKRGLNFIWFTAAEGKHPIAKVGNRLKEMDEYCTYVIEVLCSIHYSKITHFRTDGVSSLRSRAWSAFRELIGLEEKVLGPEHPDTLRTRSNLVVALGNQHKDAEAEKEFRDLITLETKVLGPEHPDTLRARSNLAYALARQGKYEEAENDFREVITTEQTALGPEHPATLASRAGLSNVLTSQGKYAEAEAECRQLIPLQEKVFGGGAFEHLG